MANIDKLVSGNVLMLFVGTGSTKQPIAYSDSASWDASRDMIAVKTKDSNGNEEYIAGDKSFNASTEALLGVGGVTGSTNNFNMLWNYYDKGCSINVVLGQSCGTGPSFTVCGMQLTGKGLIESMSISANKGDIAKASIKIKGSGPIAIS